MRFSLYIAWRYLFARKTHNAINIITLVSLAGVAVGTMALVIVLSVFNGFERLILSLFNAFHPDMEISLLEGKTFHMRDFPRDELEAMPGVLYVGEVLEETGLITYRESQHLVTFRGVDLAYGQITGIDTMLVQGEYLLEQNGRQFIIPGQGVARVLNASLHDYLHPLEIYVPRRGRTSGLHPAQAFRSSAHYASATFSVHPEYDMEYVIVPLPLMRRLLEHTDAVTSIVLRVEPGHDHRRVQRAVQEAIGPDFVVKDRIQQEAFLYRVMRSEKWAIYLILTFILLIASFNIIGSLTMLVLEKRRDTAVLHSLGASQQLIKNIFLWEGVLISLGGAMAGILAGGLVSWLQMRHGLIRVQAEGSFIIDAYPVHVQWPDLLLAGGTVFCIGMMASLIPLRNMKFHKP